MVETEIKEAGHRQRSTVHPDLMLKAVGILKDEARLGLYESLNTNINHTRNNKLRVWEAVLEVNVKGDFP